MFQADFGMREKGFNCFNREQEGAALRMPLLCNRFACSEDEIRGLHGVDADDQELEICEAVAVHVTLNQGAQQI